MRTKGWAIALLSATAAVVMSISSALAQISEVNVSEVNVRSGPGTSYAIRAALPQGVRVNVIDRNGDWAYAVAGRVEGWIYAPYLTTIGSGSGEGTGGGTITPGPTPSRYQSAGNVTNALYRGNATATVEFVGNDRVAITAIASGSTARPFSVGYYGTVTSRSRGQIVADISSFTSSIEGNNVAPLRGSCDITVSIDSSAIRNFVCQVYGSDHGRTIFNGQ